MVDPKDKDAVRQHASRGIGKEPSYAEKRARKQRAKERRADRPRERPRQRAWDEDDADARPERRAAPPGRAHEGVRVRGRTFEALVVGLGPARARIRVDAHEVDAVLAAHIASVQTSVLAVGDRVRAEERPLAPPRIVHVLPRRTKLARPDPHDPRRERLIAADLDLAVLVAACAEPPLAPGLVDRFLVATSAGGTPAGVALNKVDLLDAHERVAVEEHAATWRALDVPVWLLSAANGAGVEHLHAAIAGRRVAFVGHSGVGKSTLLNALDPAGDRATRAIGRRGRHTTSATTLRMLADGTELVDTPGVRELGLWQVGIAEVRAAFPDLDAFARACRYRDCSHAIEPGCAVRSAVAEGRLDARRAAAFARIASSLRAPA